MLAQALEPNMSDSWRKRQKAADKLFEDGDFSSATAYYLSVFKEKPKKKDIGYKAGEAGFKARRYEDVVFALEDIKNERKKFPKARFYYAMALKGLGRYQEAAVELDEFSDTYRGNDYQLMTDWATREMQGCALAQESEIDDNIKVDYLTKMVNSPRREFAPIPFGDDVLYFSSDAKIATKIYRSKRIDRTWEEPLEPAIFGAMEKEHFCGGSFTPNKKRFYFSQCDIVDGEYKCEIYVMQRSSSAWSKPIKLPDYINNEGYTAMDPFVTVEGGKEVLYFSSDREGSYGGKDIWYAVKSYNTDDLNFDIPVNLGDRVNTAQDEISPFYSDKEKTIYFSSNGLVNIGGFDVFKSKGSLSNWNEVTRLEAPINSSSDDVYFVLKEDLTSGYFSSNRLFSGEKTITDNNDLFSFTVREQEIVLEGKVHEEGNTAKLLPNVMITIYEVTNSGEYALNSNISPDGYYQFVIFPNKSYRVKAEKTGYTTHSEGINTADYAGKTTVSLDVAMPSPANVADNNSSDVRDNPPGIDVVVVDDPNDGGNDAPGPPGPPGPKIRNSKINNSDDNNSSNSDNVSSDVPGSVDDDNQSANPQREPAVPNNPTNDNPPQPVVDNNSSNNSDNNGNGGSDNNSNNDNPVFADDPVDPPVQPPSSNNQQITEFPNSDNTVGTKHLSELTRGEKDMVDIYDGKPYLKLADGFYLIDTKPKVDNDFPGVTVGIGSHYRIQLAAVTKYRDYKYEAARDLNIGDIVTEDGAVSREGATVTRVMLTSFPNFESAKEALRMLRSEGYDRAFIIRYEDDRRVGRMIRDID